MNSHISIFGIVGHAKVVIESAKLNGYIIDSLYDDDVQKFNLHYKDFPIKVPIDRSFSGSSVISIGDNKTRKIISERVSKAHWVTIIHSSAIISSDIEIGEGIIIIAKINYCLDQNKPSCDVFFLKY